MVCNRAPIKLYTILDQENVMTVFECSQKIFTLNKEGKHNEALSFFNQNMRLFEDNEIASNEYLISAMLSAFRKTDNLESAFNLLDRYDITIDAKSKGILINSYGWLLYSQYKVENQQDENYPLEHNIVDDEDNCPSGNCAVRPTSVIGHKIEQFLPLALSQNNEFGYSVFSNLFTILLKTEKRKPSPNWKLINNICDLVDPGILSTECKTIEVLRKGQKKQMELASDKENWYAHKTKALLKLGQFDECYEVSKTALETLISFHYSNDIWIARRIAISKKNTGNLSDAINDLLQVLERKKEWFIQKEIAELYKESGQLEKAFQYAVQAINNQGSIEYKIDLLFLLGELLKLKNEIELSYKHFSLSKLIRTNEEWSIPQKLITALEGFDFPPKNDIGSLKSELKKYWNSLKPEHLSPLHEKQVAQEFRLTGEIRKILHNDEKGADGFLFYNDNKSTYFRINENDGLKGSLAVGVKVTFEIQPATAVKKERAVKLLRE